MRHILPLLITMRVVAVLSGLLLLAALASLKSLVSLEALALKEVRIILTLILILHAMTRTRRLEAILHEFLILGSILESVRDVPGLK